MSVSLFSVQLSQKITLKDIVIENFTFNNARALQVFTTENLIFDNVTISDSRVSSNDLLYFENVYGAHLRNINVVSLKKTDNIILGNKFYYYNFYRGRRYSSKDWEYLRLWNPKN